jgi:hypothetical protein
MARADASIATAINAGSRAAVATELFEPVAQLTTGPVETNREVIDGHSERSRGFFDGFPAQINPLEKFAVLLRQVGQKAVKALTNCALGFGCDGGWQFSAKIFQRALASIGSPIEVDNGAPQDPVKPGNDVFIGRRFFSGLERLEKTFLDEIFGEVRIADAFPSKSDEGRQVFQDWFLKLVHNAKIRPELEEGNLTCENQLSV